MFSEDLAVRKITYHRGTREGSEEKHHFLVKERRHTDDRLKYRPRVDIGDHDNAR